MEGSPCEIDGKQEPRNRGSIIGYGSISIPELDQILEGTIPWDDIDPIIATYYPGFAASRQVTKLVEYLQNKFGVRVTKMCISKRYERLKDSGGLND